MTTLSLVMFSFTDAGPLTSKPHFMKTVRIQGGVYLFTRLGGKVEEKYRKSRENETELKLRQTNIDRAITAL